MNTAKGYHKAVADLSAAETRHRDALDALDAALSNRESHKVLGLRQAAATTERKLAEALERAQAAHRAYWLERGAELVPNLRQAALAIRRYNVIAAIAGHSMNYDPARVVIDEVHADSATFGGVGELIGDEAVPLEAPVSELLADFRGSWRGAGR